MIDNEFASCFVVSPTCSTRGGCDWITCVRNDCVVLIGAWNQSGLDLRKGPVDERLNGSGEGRGSWIRTVLCLIQFDGIANDSERRFRS